MALEFGQWRDWDVLANGAHTLPELRDMVVDSFAATHGPHFGRTRAVLGLEATHDAVRHSVEDMVRMAFRQLGGCFDSPTSESLARVVSFLSERSLSWGVPPDAVFESHSLITRAIGRTGLREYN